LNSGALNTGKPQKESNSAPSIGSGIAERRESEFDEPSQERNGRRLSGTYLWFSAGKKRQRDWWGYIYCLLGTPLRDYRGAQTNHRTISGERNAYKNLILRSLKSFSH